MLTFSFTGAEGTMVQPEFLTSGMVGKQVRFLFSPEWEGLQKTAVYMAGQTCVITTGVEDEDVIPAQVLAQPLETLWVGVYGVSSDQKVVIPTIRVQGPIILPGADPSGDPAADPTLPIWAQILQMTGDPEELLTAQKESLVAAINELYLTGGGNAGDQTQPDSIQSSESSPFAGRTASFYGDSLTEENFHYTKGYHQWVKELLELDSYNNYGKSGYKISDVYSKVSSVTDTAELVVVMCGVNDQTFSVPLGTLGDSTTATTYGSLRLLCAKLKEKYPASIVVFLTPHYQTNYPHSQGITSAEVSQAIREVCAQFAIAVYDNFSLSGIYSTNLDIYTTDNCHWNDTAHEMVGKNLSRYLQNTFAYVPARAAQTPEVTLTGIEAAFTQGDAAVYEDTGLSDLKQYLTVTASYSDGSTTAVTDYTLSGTLTQGSSTVTVSWGGMTDTFTVNVSEPEEIPVTLQSINAEFTQGDAVIYDTASLEDLRQYLTVSAHYSDGSSETVTDYTLSGTLAQGTSTVTVSYGDMTDTFAVTVTVEEVYSVPERTMEITGVKFSDGWHLCLYVAAETLPEINAGVANYGFTIAPQTDFTVSALETGGAYLVDEVNNLLAGYKEFGNSGMKATVTSNSDGSVTVTGKQPHYSGQTVTLTAEKAYWCFPVKMGLSTGDTFLISDYYVEVGGKKYDIYAIGGAFTEETCTLS